MQENCAKFINGVSYKQIVKLECKKKFCGFPDDQNSIRKKVLFHKFNKKMFKVISKKQGSN